MTKTPEQMAVDWYIRLLTEEPAVAIKKAYQTGYQAAKDEEATKDQKIAELWTESIKKMLPSVHEVVLFPSKLSNDEVVAKMDAAIKKAKGNSLNNSNGWISVKERLPDGDMVIIAYGCGVSVALYDGDWRHPVNPLSPLLSVTHWMPLPEAPKEEE